MYKKYLSGSLFTGHQLLTNNNWVLIVQEDGTIEDFVSAEEAGDDIQIVEGLLCPGFINAHCHLELSHLKGVVPEKTGMVDFVFNVMSKRANADTRLAMQDADRSMWANGIQAVGDICNTADSISAKDDSPIYYHNFVEVSGFVPAGANARFMQAKAVSEAFSHQFPRHQTSITPHSPYSVSKDLFAKIATENPSLVSVHNQESQAESDFIYGKSGDLLKLYDELGIDISFFSPVKKTSLQYMLPLLPTNAQKLFIHNCYTSQDDLNFLLAHQQLNVNNFFCLCAKANLYIGNPLPNIEMLILNGIQLCLGTDSLASNHQLSILEEIITLQSSFPAITAEMLLKMAILNGAKALKVDDKFGSFDKGKKPGILQIKGFENGMFTKKAIVQRIA